MRCGGAGGGEDAAGPQTDMLTSSVRGGGSCRDSVLALLHLGSMDHESAYHVGS